MTFAVGVRFASYADYLKAKENFEVKNNISFVVSKSDSLKRGSAREKLDIKYKRIHLICKFGSTAKSKSTGKRQTATYKKQCPAEAMISSKKVNGELVLEITKLVNRHQNHRADVTEFSLLPVRRAKVIKKNENLLKNVLAVKGNKKLIQAQLNESSESSIVTLKDIHNFNSKLQDDKLNDVQKFFSDLNSIQNANVNISVNGLQLVENIDDTTEIESIFFQDDTMQRNFELYPELIAADATYSVNDRNMPLFIMTVVDGHGETQIVGLIILKSENIRAIQSGLTAFKANNPNHVKTKVNKYLNIFNFDLI